MTAANAPWPPNWTQLVPDLLVATFTGLLIGLILAWLQHRMATEQLETQYRQDYSRALPSISAYFDGPPTRTADSWNHYASFNGLLDILRDLPLSEWSRRLKDPTVAHLERFESDLFRFRHCAAQLDDSVLRAVIHTRPQTLPKTQQAQRFREAVVAARAAILDLDLSETRSWFGEGNLPEPDLHAWARDALADRQVQEQVGRYRATLASLDTNRGQINAQLIQPQQS